MFDERPDRKFVERRTLFGGARQTANFRSGHRFGTNFRPMKHMGGSFLRLPRAAPNPRTPLD
eukprot:11627311-Alexandrium_andersonii.AAC.1